MKQLSNENLNRAAVLLDIIVRPGDHNFGPAVEEAQALLGYEVKRTRAGKRRSFYGIRKLGAKKE